MLSIHRVIIKSFWKSCSLFDSHNPQLLTSTSKAYRNQWLHSWFFPLSPWYTFLTSPEWLTSILNPKPSRWNYLYSPEPSSPHGLRTDSLVCQTLKSQPQLIPPSPNIFFLFSSLNPYYCCLSYFKQGYCHRL